ncbi:hypothetical protein H6F50_18610 [Coleofasciculus sp. FACHB-712]|uniref:hypothetical protein n=1 Tax=Coleofasciculus sp. FACHB-712 TaxID=2692789 RepID=UPI0016892B11|nr:hypothetical protein [Coleofasciculus sp. FACHB-712]MBD1944342.1 hypothetical protein [Coleofasciculus sp. FACHB-712]
MAQLGEVFGIATSIPKYTYVDRASLDKRFRYLLGRDQHIVIYGASKQGKTILRKKNLPENQCVTVQCRSNSTLEQIYVEILRQLNTQIPTEITNTLTFGAEGKGKVSGGMNIPYVASGSTELEGSGSVEKGSERVYEPVGIGPDSLGYIAEEIKRSQKRVVIEDFHYLPDDEKKRLAFDLKAFWDNSVFFIIIGIWAEQNLLTYYNGDLSGRVNEIDVQWTNEELQEVLRQGEEALNFLWHDSIRQGILTDANQNVGLLQRIAESYCFEADILETQEQRKTITDLDALDRCRRKICNEESVRYRQFSEAVSRGFRGSESSELKVYQRIVRVCVEALDAELCNGLNRDVILARINESGTQVRLSDLSAALNKLDKLQADRSITPLIISYNPDSRKVQLVDRELLFYRNYGNPTWSWEETENG